MKDLKEVLPYYLNTGALVGDGRTPFELTDKNYSNVVNYLTRIYLLPLSALTEPLEDGTVPIEELYEQFGSTSGFGKGFWKNGVIENLNGNIQNIQFKYVQFLLKNHFDVWNLIDNGLAIDKRTLNQ